MEFQTVQILTPDDFTPEVLEKIKHFDGTITGIEQDLPRCKANTEKFLAGESPDAYYSIVTATLPSWCTNLFSEWVKDSKQATLLG